MYADYEIREVPIGYGPARRKVEEFLGKRTLRLDKVDYYEAIYPVVATRCWPSEASWATPSVASPSRRAWRTSTWPTAWCPI